MLLAQPLRSLLRMFECRKYPNGFANSLLLALVAFFLYTAFAAHDILFGDGPELTAAAITGGVGHPPGYPLWIMLGQVATWFPFGTLAYRVNCTAALYHALTVGLVTYSGYLLTRSIISAAVAGCLLMLTSPLFFHWSVQAEVFSLNDCFAAALACCTLLWITHPRQRRYPLLAATIFGLGCSNHQTLVLLMPLLFWAIWCARHELVHARYRFTIFAAPCIAFVAFCVPYVHTILASQRLTAWNLGAATDLQSLIDLVDRKAFGSFTLVTAKDLQGGSVFVHFATLIHAGGLPYIFVALGVLSLLHRRAWTNLTLAMLIGLATIAFCTIASINVTNDPGRAVFERFGLLPLVALAPFAACSINAFKDFIRFRPVRMFLALVACGAALFSGIQNLQTFRYTDVHDVRNVFTDIEQALPPHAILLTVGDAMELPPEYLQSVEQWRPDVTVIQYGFLASPTYLYWLSHQIRIPYSVVVNQDILMRRDLLAAANTSRPFYVVGDEISYEPGPNARTIREGLVGHIIPNSTAIDAAGEMAVARRNVSRPGYGNISTDRLRTNGFGALIRQHYDAGAITDGSR